MRSVALPAGLLVGLLMAACGGEPPPPDAHGRRLDELAHLAETAVPGNRFLGDQELLGLEQQLAALPAEGWDERRHELLVRVAVHALRLGRTEEAIDALEQAVDLVPSLPPGDRKRAALTTHFGLGIAYLRLGENRNCVLCKTSASCLLPISEEGQHDFPEGSQAAIGHFRQVLEGSPGRAVGLKARWLLNIAHMTVGSWPDGVEEAYLIPAETFEGADFTRFTDVAAGTGLDTLDLSGGVVIEDFDGDGRLDVLTSTWDFAGDMHLFHNEGTGVFSERTDEAGLTGLLGGLNMTGADYDDDGDVDVLVLRAAWFADQGRHPNSLLRNDGGRFTDVSVEAGLGDVDYPTQAAAWADYDGDGDLDLYVGNEAGPRHRYPSQLFRNEGDGRFTDVASEAGVENLRYAKGASWGDYDDDGDPDLYVSNLSYAYYAGSSGNNRLYRNEGDGTFTDVAEELGVTGPEESFATWFWDYDNDGHLDVYVAGYVEDAADMVAAILGQPHDADHGRLYRNDGEGGFEDVTEDVGLDRLVTTMGAGFGDLDNDGWLDLYLGTGYPSYEALVPNVMYRNVEGRRFEDVTTAGGFGHLQKGHGVAFADLDDDGDQDVFEQMGGAYAGDGFHNVLYENPGHGNHWVRLRLEGTDSHRAAFGARVAAEIAGDDGVRTIHRQVCTGGSFGSAPLELHLGLGGAETVERLTVRWPGSGRVQVFEGVEADRRYRLVEGEEALREEPTRPFDFRRP